uniref:Uncharacterized protein n=1 Tax=Romanomermis culicivorax TaxID=13658 RepID=A0A915JYD5_ROMCU
MIVQKYNIRKINVGRLSVNVQFSVRYRRPVQLTFQRVTLTFSTAAWQISVLVMAIF